MNSITGQAPGPSYLSEPEPPRGVATDVAPGIRRLVAPNPGQMTYHGTNTYLVETEAGTLVVDPGPDEAHHRQAILAACGDRIGAIVLTHTHSDHFAGVPALKSATGAPVAAFRTPAVPDFVPHLKLDHGSALFGWTALFTPGHAADHLCFSRADGVLLSGDHVMSFSSSIVSPPQGNMADYFRSLELLLARNDRVYLPGHGPPIEHPQPFVMAMLRHRQAREHGILASIAERGGTLKELTARLYPTVSPLTLRAAERIVLAHLIKLEREGRARNGASGWTAV